MVPYVHERKEDYTNNVVEFMSKTLKYIHVVYAKPYYKELLSNFAATATSRLDVLDYSRKMMRMICRNSCMGLNKDTADAFVMI